MQQTKSKQITYQTRIISSELDEILTSYAELFSSVERKLFTAIVNGKENINTLKKEYLKAFEITARQFNSCRSQVEGKIKSYEALKEEHIKSLKQKIKNLDAKIEKYKDPNKIHQKKRKLFNLRTELKNLEKETKPKICFGSKKLFKAQFNLEENGFKDHAEWKAEWTRVRNNSFFLIGSKEESSGNQSCQIFKDEHGLSLKLRLPDKLSKNGKYITIKNLNFSYGTSEIYKAIENNLKRKELQSQKNPLYKFYGKAISYRLVKDKKGFRIFITISLDEPEWISNKENGVIGVDINANHLAVVETDRFLNPIKVNRIPLDLYGKNKNQSLAIIGDAVAKIVDMAIESQKPIIIEKLDFQKKKVSLKEKTKKCARILTSFAYRKIIEMINSRTWRSKIQTLEVNPAYTSLIGRIKFAKRYGMTIHQAAALTIGRRFMNFSENPPHQCIIPDAKGSMRAFFLPARNRKKHLWSFWGQVFGILKTVDAPHFRAADSRSSSTRKSTLETGILENYERDSHTLKFVDKTARSTSLKKSLL